MARKRPIGYHPSTVAMRAVARAYEKLPLSARVDVDEAIDNLVRSEKPAMRRFVMEITLALASWNLDHGQADDDEDEDEE